MRGTSSKGPQTHASDLAKTLEDKHQRILEMLSVGLSQEAILASDPTFTRSDIAESARQALTLATKDVRPKRGQAAETIARYPRAYERWCADEELRIVDLYKCGKTMREIAALVERQPSAVKSRLQKMGVF